MTAVALPSTDASPRTTRVAPALLRSEAARLARSPALWIAATVFLALRTSYTWQWLPDMNSEPVVTVGTSQLIAATVLILANLAASRDKRMAESLAAVPGGASVRTWAVAVAAAVVGASVCALAMGVHLAVRLLMSGTVAGRADPYELLGGVAVTALAAVIGVALGRWVPSLIAGPLAVIALGVLSLAGVTVEPGRWLLPMVVIHEPQWGPRPSGWHALYLVGLVVLFGALAMLRHGVRPWRAVGAVAGLAVAVPGAVAAEADGPTMPWTATRRQLAAAADTHGYGPQDRVCTTRNAVTYCPFADYTVWVPAWEEVMGPLAAAVPPAARERIPVLLQQFPGNRADTGKRASVDIWPQWTRADHPSRSYLAGSAAAVVTGLTGGTASPAERGRMPSCDASGQARTVVALWLAGQGAPLLPAGQSVLVAVPTGTATMPSQLGPITYGAAEDRYARLLLDRPDTRDRVWAAWETLTNPRTTLTQALPLLGLPPGDPAPSTATPKGRPCS